MVTTSTLEEFLAQKQFSLAIFDLDNTLIDLNVEWGPLKAHLAQKHQEFFNKPRDFSRLLPALDGLRAEFGVDHYACFSDIVTKWELEAARTLAVERKDRTRFLAYLKQKGKKIAIFTGNSKNAAEEALNRFHLCQLVDYIVGRREVAKQKPDPHGLQLILQHFQFQPDNAVFVGDAEVDRLAGEAAGIPTFIIS